MSYSRQKKKLDDYDDNGHTSAKNLKYLKEYALGLFHRPDYWNYTSTRVSVSNWTTSGERQS